MAQNDVEVAVPGSAAVAIPGGANFFGCFFLKKIGRYFFSRNTVGSGQHGHPEEQPTWRVHGDTKLAKTPPPKKCLRNSQNQAQANSRYRAG